MSLLRVGVALLITVPAANVAAAPLERDLHVFRYSSADGTSPTLGTLAPNGGLLIGKSGDLIGTADGLFAPSSGHTPNGIVFRLTPPPPSGNGNWTETPLYRFAGGADGISPNGNLIANAQGVLFGTTCIYSNYDAGTVFMLAPPRAPRVTWTHTVIHSFTGGGMPNDPQGTCPQTGVVADSRGRLYGTTAYGGSGNGGVIWQLAPPSAATKPWTYSVVHDYDQSYQGNVLTYPLLREHSGVIELYGTTSNGGANGHGTVFRATSPAAAGAHWRYDILYSFTGGTDGGEPFWGLVADRSLNLYGSTALGHGTVFRLAPPSSDHAAWTETVLHSFAGGTDGSTPMGVTEPVDGKLYGATQTDGDPNCRCGTVFKLTPRDYGGQLLPWNSTTLYRFTSAHADYPNGALSSLLSGSGQLQLFGATTGTPGGYAPDSFGSVYTLQP